MQVPADHKNNNQQFDYVNFANVRVERCQAQFKKLTEVAFNKQAKLKEIEATMDPDKKKLLHINYKEKEYGLRMKSVGRIRFIGELFKVGILTTDVVHNCIEYLLSEGDELCLELLCKLMMTLGKDLENENEDLTIFIARMIETSNGRVSSRVRFMLRI